MKREKTILITGGHLTPAMSIINELRRRGYDSFIWVGRRKTMKKDKNDSAEYNVIKNDLEIPFIDITTGKVIKFNSLKTLIESIINIIKIPIGFIQSIFLLIKTKPKIIISFGGYIAVPIVLAGWFLDIPSVTHEQTIIVGKANKFISKFSKKIFISWEESKKYFTENKVILTGNPVRKEVLISETNNYNLNMKLKTIYVTGGNQGSHIINQNIKSIIKKLLEKYNVIHQTGITTVTKDFEECDRIEKSLTGKTKGNYIVKGHVFGIEIGEIFNKADIIISRAGANTMTEIFALGKPAILIPISWSLNNEQFENAKKIEKIGLGKIIEEKDLKPKILKKYIDKAFKLIKKGKDFNEKSLKKTISKAKDMINLKASEIIANETIKMIE